MAYIGIDPSQNSTGISVFGDNGDLLFTVNVVFKEKKPTKKAPLHTGHYEAHFGNYGKLILSEQLEKCIVEIFSSWDNKIAYVFNSARPMNDMLKAFAYYNVMQKVFQVILEFADGCVLGEFYGANVFVGIEYPMGKWIDSSMKAFNTCCILLKEYSVYIAPVNPKTAKKFVTGSGNAGKPIVVKEVFKRWGFDTNIDDLADAYALGRFTYETKPESVYTGAGINVEKYLNE